MPVGLLDFATFHSIRFSLGVGERIVLLSDGVSEAEDPAGVQFSAEELGRAVIAPDAVGAIFAGMTRFVQGAHAADDQTALAIERVA